MVIYISGLDEGKPKKASPPPLKGPAIKRRTFFAASLIQLLTKCRALLFRSAETEAGQRTDAHLTDRPTESDRKIQADSVPWFGKKFSMMPSDVTES